MQRLHVFLLPEWIPAGSLSGSVAVVIDVLRATTTMTYALAAGAACVRPCGEANEARALAASMPQGSVVLGGERQGVRIEGFDLGNSPSEYSAERIRNKTVVFTTTNGTRALARATEAGAERVLIGAFCNRRAVVRELLNETRDAFLVCAGTNGRVTFEDVLFAGEVCSGLLAAGVEFQVDDSAALALSAAEFHSRSSEFRLAALRRSLGGSNLLELGFDADIETAAQCDVFDFVPELHRDTWRIESPLR